MTPFRTHDYVPQQCIDPRLLLPDSFQAAGSWVDYPTQPSQPVLSTATTVRSNHIPSTLIHTELTQPDLSGIVLNDLIDDQPLPPAFFANNATISRHELTYHTVDENAICDVPPTAGLRPDAEAFVPKPLRPELRLITSQPQQRTLRTPNDQHTPTSAPDIAVITPDGVTTPVVFPDHHQWQPRPRQQRRPRRNTTGDPKVPPPGYARMRGTSGSPSRPRSGLARPLLDPFWLMNAAYNPGDRLAHQKTPLQSVAPPMIMTTSSRPSSDTLSQTSTMNECSTCGKRHRLPSELRHHERYHTLYQHRPCVCNLCGARFLFENYLTRHMKKTDHAQPQLPCPDCGRLFGRVDHVERHRRTHMRPSGVETPALSMASSGPSSERSPVSLRARSLAVHNQAGPSTPATEPLAWPLPCGLYTQQSEPYGYSLPPELDDAWFESALSVPPSPTPMSRIPTNRTM